MEYMTPEMKIQDLGDDVLCDLVDGTSENVYEDDGEEWGF